MPYRTKRDLPEDVRAVLSKTAQEIWRSAFNRRGSTELAWSAVKDAGYRNGDGGKWTNVKKARLRLDPPGAVRINVERGLALEKENELCFEGVPQALTEGRSLSLSEVREVYDFFESRNQGDSLAIKTERFLWGGEAGKRWVDRVLKQEGMMSEGQESTIRYETDVVKVDDSLGIVFGWGIVCTKDGEEFFDLQKHHCPESVMLDAAVDFMESDRETGEMHKRRNDRGLVVFMFPLTAEIAKHYKIETQATGLLMAVKPNDSEVLEKFRDGTYSGFSLQGKGVLEEVEDGA